MLGIDIDIDNASSKVQMDRLVLARIPGKVERPAG